MSIAVTAALVFVCGGLYEATCVGFIHSSERDRPLRTALFSMLGAAAEVTGLLGAVHDWRVAPFFVGGYGLGSYLAVKSKRGTRPPPETPGPER